MSSYTGQGNIAKVKYFLHGSRGKAPKNQIPQNQNVSLYPYGQRQTPSASKYPSRKVSSNYKGQQAFGIPRKEVPAKLDIEIIGVSENIPEYSSGFEDIRNSIGKSDPKRHLLPNTDITAIFSNHSEEQNFYRFLQDLRNDHNYQNTITMFTIMYYYQKKKEHKG